MAHKWSKPNWKNDLKIQPRFTFTICESDFKRIITTINDNDDEIYGLKSRT